MIQRRHNFLDRNALLVRACSEAVQADDQELLRQHGIGYSLLGEAPAQWVVKWAALVLRYIEASASACQDQALGTLD